MNATTWSSLGVPVNFVRLLRASAKRRVILTTDAMVMASALGETDPGGCWEEPRSGLQSETVWCYCSWFGDLGGQTTLRTAPVPQSDGVADANVVGMTATAWFYRRQDRGPIGVGM